MSASLSSSFAAAYGAEWLVVTSTSNPARFTLANARSCACTSSPSPVISMSKATPWKPASLIAASPSLVNESSTSTVMMPFPVAPPMPKNGTPLYRPALGE